MNYYQCLAIVSKTAVIVTVSIVLGYGCATKGKAPRYYHHSYHTVSKGETLYSISFKYGVSLKQLASWNNIAEPYVIYPGQKLRLNSSARSKNTSSTAQKSTQSEQDTVAAKPIGKWQWPVQGKVIRGYSDTNNGIDIVAPEGTLVKAAASGKVVYAGDSLRGYGNLIIIKHNSSYFSAYAHNKQLLVKEEDTIGIGQNIAKVGRTGADRVMLHFEIRKDGNPVDPKKYLP